MHKLEKVGANLYHKSNKSSGNLHTAIKSNEKMIEYSSSKQLYSTK
jgi:hypothetical protein